MFSDFSQIEMYCSVQKLLMAASNNRKNDI